MKTQKWMFLASIILFLGAIALVAFTILTPYVWAQGPDGWFGPGNGGGPMFGRGFGPRFGMGPGNGPMFEGDYGPGFGMGRGRGGMYNGDFGPGFGMGPGGGPGRMMGLGGNQWGGPENALIAVAAEELGLTRQELIAELQGGKTIADVAAEKNVAVETIVDAFLAPRAERLNELVANGQLTQEQADTQLAQMKTNVTERINQPWPSQGSRWGGPENSLISIAADELGLTTTELVTELQAGKTIADVAAEKNVAVETIVDAFLAPRAEQLKEQVANGQLTQEQADAMLALMKANVNKRISEPWPQGRGFGYADEDGDGICDHAGQGRMGGRWGGGGMMGFGNW
jgi:hypothetical protein